MVRGGPRRPEEARGCPKRQNGTPAEVQLGLLLRPAARSAVPPGPPGPENLFVYLVKLDSNIKLLQNSLKTTQKLCFLALLGLWVPLRNLFGVEEGVLLELGEGVLLELGKKGGFVGDAGGIFWHLGRKLNCLSCFKLF